MRKKRILRSGHRAAIVIALAALALSLRCGTIYWPGGSDKLNRLYQRMDWQAVAEYPIDCSSHTGLQCAEGLGMKADAYLQLGSFDQARTQILKSWQVLDSLPLDATANLKTRMFLVFVHARLSLAMQAGETEVSNRLALLDQARFLLLSVKDELKTIPKTDDLFKICALISECYWRRIQELPLTEVAYDQGEFERIVQELAQIAPGHVLTRFNFLRRRFWHEFTDKYYLLGTGRESEINQLYQDLRQIYGQALSACSHPTINYELYQAADCNYFMSGINKKLASFNGFVESLRSKIVNSFFLNIDWVVARQAYPFYTKEGQASVRFFFILGDKIRAYQAYLYEEKSNELVWLEKGGSLNAGLNEIRWKFPDAIFPIIANHGYVFTIKTQFPDKENWITSEPIPFTLP